ncbi:methyltransferase domain-containing protein [Pseudofrankia saprophytica]|uniref:class I SAM-dependent methyltransferase n=1 Tax=Pseudofrankia saprophytica TaxID=298655 RepID=UPI000234BF2A
MVTSLLNEDALTASSVVANRAMNRERQLTGVNSYERELGFRPLDWLRARLTGDDRRTEKTRVAWLDLCCGTGRALLQAADALRTEGLGDVTRLVGIDLVDAFTPRPPGGNVELVTASVVSWQPSGRFDLITCVHGLHYVGDKLAVLTRAVDALTETGLFIADFDAASIRRPDGQPMGRGLTTALRAAGLSYDARRHRLACHGRREILLPFRYLGADDHAGPNYTHQPAVHSYYQPGS